MTEDQAFDYVERMIGHWDRLLLNGDVSTGTYKAALRELHERLEHSLQVNNYCDRAKG